MISYTTFCFNFLGFPHCLGVIQSLWGTEPTLLWRPSCGSQLFTYVGDWTLTITPRNVHLAVPVSDSMKLRQWIQLLSPWLRLSPSLGDDQALKQNFTILTKAYLGAFEDFACKSLQADYSASTELPFCKKPPLQTPGSSLREQLFLRNQKVVPEEVRGILLSSLWLPTRSILPHPAPPPSAPPLVSTQGISKHSQNDFQRPLELRKASTAGLHCDRS